MAEGPRSTAAPLAPGRRRAAPARRRGAASAPADPATSDPAEAGPNADPEAPGGSSAAAPGRPAANGTRSTRLRKLLVFLGCSCWLAAVVVAGGVLARPYDVAVDVPVLASRVAAAVATWLAVTVLVRRCGGRYLLVALFAAIVLSVVVAVPERWSLAGVAVAAAVVHGLLGMVITRPAAGLRTVKELLVSAVVGVGGAMAVTGFDVDLRPFRFRLMVLTLVLVGGFALAWRLGHGVRSIGRRGVVVIAVGTALLILSVAYTQAIRTWGSAEVKASLEEAQRWLVQRAGAVPRPIEAVVGFPALVWGVAIRNRRRQGWWMCAFGGLGAAGVATSLVQSAVPLKQSAIATGYDVALGAVLGLVVVAIDRLLTGPGGRRVHSAAGDLERPEPPRFAPLL